MFTRVILNITKHKVLNILLVLLFILSFVGVAFSSVFVYKTNAFLDKIDDSEDFIIMSQRDLEGESSYDISFDFYDYTPYFELYNDVLKDNKNINTSIDAYSYMFVIEEFEDYYEGGEEESNLFLEIMFSDSLAQNYLKLDKDFDKSKVYIQEELADKYNLSVGDTLTLSTLSEDEMYVSDTINYTSSQEIEIGGIVSANPEQGNESRQVTIYIPFEILAQMDPKYIKMSDLTFNISGPDEEVEKVYEEAKEFSNDANIYYSKTYESSDLEFFTKIQRFFTVILISTIVILALAFLSLNNNIMDRRTDEFRLYNIFGLKSGKILVQIIIEKVVLFTLSLLIAIPLFLSMIRTGNTIVDNLVKYSLANDMTFATLAQSSGNDELNQLLYNGISDMNVYNILIILFAIIIVMLIIILITVIQFMIDNNKIVNQRRGE